MAQLALTLVGAVVGGYLGGPTGAQLGAAAGAAVGGVVEGLMTSSPKTNSPHVEDHRAQYSTYGVPIPIPFGAIRTSGNIIWMVPIHPVASSQSTGAGGDGAGSGAGSSTTTTYIYYSSFAISWGRGPIEAVLRIWADGKLIWDNRPKSRGGVRNLHGATVRHYFGTNTQLPDPTMQKHIGKEFCSAFRGQAYSVFDNMFLTGFGNRIPNFTAEIVTVATPSYPSVNHGGAFGPIQILIDESRQMIYLYNSGAFEAFDMLAGQYIAQFTPIALPASPDWTAIGYDGYAYYGSSILGTTPIYKVDLSSGEIADQTPNNVYFPDRISSSPLHDYLIGSAYSTFLNEMFVICKTTTAKDGTKSSAMRFIAELHWAGHYNAVVDPQSITISGTTTTFDVWAIDGDGKLTKYEVTDLGANGTIVAGTTYSDLTAIVGSGWRNLVYQDADHSLICGGASGGGANAPLAKFDLGAHTVVQTLSSVIGFSWNWDQGPSNNIMVGDSGSGAVLVDTISLEEIERVAYVNYGLPYIFISNAIPVYDSRGNSLFVNGLAQLFLDRQDSQGVSLSSVVTALCEEGGLTSGQIDASQLASDTVWGYLVGRQGAVRAALQPLATAYFFDAVESDFKIKFVKRGGTPVAALSVDDLGAYAGNNRPDPFMPVEIPEQELPRRVYVTYLNRGNRYENGAQSDQRNLQGSQIAAKMELNVPIPIAFNDDEAKVIAARLLALAWVKRWSVPLSLTRKWLALDPGDIAILPKDGNVFSLRFTQTDLGLNGVINAAAEFEDASIYTLAPFGAGSSGGLPDPGQGGETGVVVVYFLDTVMLRDEDDNTGFYLAAAPLDDSLTFNGATIDRSIDGGETYQSWEVIALAATAGAATDTLPNAPGGRWNTWDRVNSVTVRIHSGETNIASAANELAVLNGANVAILGSEVIAFATAIDNGDGTFTLSTLLRALRGSSAYTTTHDLGDRFILITGAGAEILSITGSSADFGVARLYKSYPIGADSLPANFTTFTDTAIRKKPLEPTNPLLAVSGSDLVISWQRQTRIGGENDWADTITNVPLGEDSEAYAVEIYNGSTLLRTLSSSTNSVTYTVAQITADFGGAQIALHVVIYQISEVVGRGFPCDAVVAL